MAELAQKVGEKPDNNFKTLVAGFQWPSLDWGNEKVPENYDDMIAKIAKEIAKDEKGTAAIKSRFGPVGNAQDTDITIQLLIENADLPEPDSTGEFLHIPDL